MRKRDGRGNAGTAAALRLVVAGYLVYLGVDLIGEHLKGSSALPAGLVWVCGAAFLIAGAAFGWYSWKRYRAEADADDGDPDDGPP